MAPTANDPYAPHTRRPRRTPEPGAPTPSDDVCLICAEAADAGKALILPAHDPSAHIGSTIAGVVLSRSVTQDEGTLGTWQGEWDRAWWEANTPDDVDVLSVYSPGRIPLPDEIAAGMLANGATAEETEALEDRWNEGTDEDRAGAVASFGEFTPEDWNAFVAGWRTAIADPDVVATLFLTPAALNGLRSEPTEEEAKGNDLARQQEEVDAWAAGHDDPQAALADLVAWDEAVNGDRTEGTFDGLEQVGGPSLPEEVPEGMVRVSVTWGDPDDPEQSFGVTGDVPEEHAAVMDMLTASDGMTDDEQALRARLVLAGELTRPESKRRKSILAAVTETLGEAEVAERTAAAAE